MTRALLERCRDYICCVVVYNRQQSADKHDLIDAIDAELAKPAQQERKPCHTEAEVQEIMRSETGEVLENLIRRILGVPAPKETP